MNVKYITGRSVEYMLWCDNNKILFNILRWLKYKLNYNFTKV